MSLPSSSASLAAEGLDKVPSAAMLGSALINSGSPAAPLSLSLDGVLVLSAARLSLSGSRRGAAQRSAVGPQSMPQMMCLARLQK